MNTFNNTFDTQSLADDLLEVCRIYAEFFAALNESDWDKPVKGDPQEWTLHETIAHLCALNGAGLESIKHTLRGEPYIFAGLEDRYKLNAYNRKGIDDLMDIPMKELCARFLDIHTEAARIARNLRPDQAGLTSSMSIYNRPVSIVEALSILSFHAGVIHATQVAEPAGVAPLWEQPSPEIRHRMIGRVMRAFHNFVEDKAHLQFSGQISKEFQITILLSNTSCSSQHGFYDNASSFMFVLTKDLSGNLFVIGRNNNYFFTNTLRNSLVLLNTLRFIHRASLGLSLD